jgi:hypothetical protein
MQANKPMASPPHQKRTEQQHCHSPLRLISDGISSQQATAQQSNPQCVQAKNSARTCVILPRGGGFPNQTIVAEGNQEQAVRVMAGSHMGGGQQTFSQIRRDLKRPRTQDKEWTMINKDTSTNQQQR